MHFSVKNNLVATQKSNFDQILLYNNNILWLNCRHSAICDYIRFDVWNNYFTNILIILRRIDQYNIII